MVGELLSFGSGILAELLSSSLEDRLSKRSDRNAVRKLKESLVQFEIDFEKAHDGTIATRGEFLEALKACGVMDRIVRYVWFPELDVPGEEDFLKTLEEALYAAMKQARGRLPEPSDRQVVKEFLSRLLDVVTVCSREQCASGTRHILYNQGQTHAAVKEIEDLVVKGDAGMNRKLDCIIETMQARSEQAQPKAKVAELPPEFDDYIRTYNRGVRNARNRINIYLMKNLELDAIYVQPTLKIRERTMDPHNRVALNHKVDQTVWQDVLHMELQSSLDRLYPMGMVSQVSIDRIFDMDNIIYVVGGAGYGKSLFLRNLEVNPSCLNGFQSRPLLILCGDMKRFIRADGTLKPMLEFLEECFSNHSLARSDEIAPGFLQSCLDAGRCLILLDALDEVVNDQREAIHNLIVDYFQQYAPDNRVCMTSRDRVFIPREQVTCFCIEPITVEDVSRYVDRFIALNRFVREEKERFVEQAAVLVENGFVKGFLTLSLLMVIYQNEQELPANKVSLYEKCFEYMAKSREKGKNLLCNSETNEPYDWEQLGQFMQDATFMGLARLGYPNNADIPESSVRAFLSQTYRPSFKNDSDCQTAIEQFLQFCSDRTEILVPADDKNRYYRFYHRSFFEYFIAKQIWKETHTEQETYEALLAFNTDSEVFELLVAMYMQTTPDHLQKLLDYAFEMAESTLGGNGSPIHLNLLVMLMQTVRNSDYIHKFIVFFTEPKNRISQKHLDVSYLQISCVLKQDPVFLQKRLKDKLTSLMNNVEYELIGYLKNPKHENEALFDIKNKVSASDIIWGDCRFTYGRLLAELPESDQLLECRLNQLRTPSYLMDRHPRLGLENARMVLRLVHKILSLPVERRRIAYQEIYRSL